VTDLLLPALVVVAAVAALAFRAAARARESERRYRQFAAQWPDTAIALLDQDLRFALAEGAVLAADWEPRELVGRRLDEVLPAEAFAELEPKLAAALAGERLTHELGGDRAYRVEVAPFRASGGAVTHVMLALRDVTAANALRRTLEEQTGFLNAVLMQLGERVSVCDADGHFIDFGALHTAGRTELHPLEWSEAFGLQHPDGRPLGPHEAPLLRALRGEQVRDVELRVPSGDGDATTLLASGGPVTAVDGRTLGAVVVNADLTPFRDAEGRLRRSEERHRRVVESMVDCVFETDVRGQWTYLSDAWTATTGYAVDASLGRSCLEYVHPDDRAAHALALAPLLAGERTGVQLEHRFLTSAGAVRWAEVQVRAVSGWNGLPAGFTGVIRDVTAAQRARQYAAAETALMRLLSGVPSGADLDNDALAVLGHELDWDGAELWCMGGDERLRRMGTWTAPGVDLDELLAERADRRHEVGDGLVGQAWLSRAPLWHDGLCSHGECSTVALTVRRTGEPIAVVVLISRTPREPEPGLDRLLNAISGHVTQFIQRREAEARAAQQAADLQRLSAVAHELAGESDQYGARMALTRAVRDVTDANAVILWEPDVTGTELEVTAATGAALRGMTVPLGDSTVIAAAFATGELAFVSEVATDPRVAYRRHELAHARSGAWVPVVGDGRAVGVLLVGWARRRATLPERDRELLGLLAAEAAITIQRTDLLAQLRATARTDPLTGLPNRRVWDEDLARELARARRHGGSLCLALLDLDRFKAFNDDHGHQAGDELLAAAATAWRPELRATDTLARYGGEEFAVLLPHSDATSARAVVERLLAAVPFGQTASAGIAVWDGVERAEQLLARADAALYRAKNAGRARAQVAS